MAMSEAVHDGNVVHLPFTEGQALDDLRALGRTRLRTCDLARRWQWPPKNTARAIDRWSKNNLISRRRGLITACPIPANDVRPAVPRTVPKPVSGTVPRTGPKLVPKAVPIDVPEAVRETVPKDVQKTPDGTTLGHVPNSHKWLATLAILLGCALSGIGLGWSLVTLARGQGGAAAMLMAAAFVGIEFLAISAPSFATALWGLRYHVFAIAMWVGYAVALGAVIFNATGGAAMQIGDMVAGRAGVIESASDVRAELDALLLERGPMKFVPVDPAMVGTAEDKRDRACERAPKGKACEVEGAKVTALGLQRATNERLTVLDAQIRALRDKRDNGSALSAVDPQIESTIGILALASGGSLAPSKRTVEIWRLLELVLIPCVMGGLCLAAGFLLWQGRRA